jgi:HK97 family phage major capsid protein
MYIEHKNAGERQDDKLELKGLADSLKQRDAEIKGWCEKASAEIKNLGTVSTETKSALEKLSESGNDLMARMQDVEQKLARRPGGDEVQVKSLGQSFTDSDDFKALQGKGARGGRASIGVKAISSLTPASGGAAVRPERVEGILALPEREMTVRDLIMPGRTESNAVEYVQVTGFTNNAGTVAELAKRAQSDLQFGLKTANVRTIGHWLPASREILKDVPQLQTFIDGIMVYGLKYEEEEQILGGDGTGTNLLGLLPQASQFQEARRKVTDTPIDILRKAILQVRLAQFRATGIVLNPTDWADIELQKDSTGQYVWVNLGTSDKPLMWRVPVIDTTAIPENEFLVGSFTLGSQLFDREEATVQVSTEDGENFVKGACTVLAEERMALAVYRPESFVTGELRK